MHDKDRWTTVEEMDPLGRLRRAVQIRNGVDVVENPWHRVHTTQVNPNLVNILAQR
jgi:hypothetical protein